MDVLGDPISAERAYNLGFVNDLVEPGKALEGALKLAKRIEGWLSEVCSFAVDDLELSFIVNAPLAVREARNVSLKTVSMSDEEVSFVHWLLIRQNCERLCRRSRNPRQQLCDLLRRQISRRDRALSLKNERQSGQESSKLPALCLRLIYAFISAF